MTRKEFNTLKINDYIMHKGLKDIYKIVGKTNPDKKSIDSNSLARSIYYQISCVSTNSIVNVAVIPRTWKKLSQLDKVKLL